MPRPRNTRDLENTLTRSQSGKRNTRDLENTDDP